MRKGRPRSWSVYYTFNDEGTIYNVFYGNTIMDGDHIRKYKSGLSSDHAILLCKIMKSKYNIDNIDIDENIPDILKYLKLPPKTHKSRLNEPWNKGIKSDKVYKT